MKMFFSFLMMLALDKCYSATGSARDSVIFVGLIIVILLLFLAAGYFIDFVKSRIKNAMAKRWLKKNVKDQDKEFEDSCIEALPGLNISLES
jgi:hypothetical protein